MYVKDNNIIKGNKYNDTWLYRLQEIKHQFLEKLNEQEAR